MNALAIVVVSGQDSKSIHVGPGIVQKHYDSDQIYRIFSTIESSKKNRLGHASMQMFKGYLMGLEVRDGGRGDGAFAFWDVSNPHLPKRVVTYEDEYSHALFEGHNYGFLKHDSKDYVFLSAQKGLQIWDMTNVHKPTHVSSLDVPGLTSGAYANTVWWLAIQYPYIYLGGTNTGVHVVDASELENPKLVRSVPTSKLGGFKVGSLFACGNLLFANTFDAPGFSVIDISHPTKPHLIKFINEKFGYSMLFNGGYLYGIGKKPLIWDVRDPSRINKISHYEGKHFGGKGGYGVFQDGFLHMGNSRGYVKLDVRNKRNPKIAKRIKHAVPFRDYDGANVIGNLVLMTCDHGTGSHFFAHTEKPDTQGPLVNFISPAHESVNNMIHSRIGLTFTDEIDHESLQNILVRPLGGEPIDGHWSFHNCIANFCPNKPLAQATTYEVIVPAGAVKDQVGNPLTEPFRSVFSTGHSISDFNFSILENDAVVPGALITFKIESSLGDVAYAWDFGDGTQQTAYSTDTTIRHHYEKPGRYSVIAHAIRGEQKGSAQTSQLVHNIIPKQTANYASSIAIARNGLARNVWVVNPDNNSVTAIHGKEKLVELEVSKNPRTLSIVDNVVAVVSQDAATLTLIDNTALKILKVHQLPFASQPYGVALDATAQTAYVTSQAFGHIYAVDCDSGKIIHTYQHPSMQNLRGIGINNQQNILYATRFISPDNQAEVYKIDLPQGDVTTIGLKIDATPDSDDSGRGLPNYLSQIALSPDGTSAWIPSKKDNIQRGLYRDGQPLTFESTVRPILSNIDLKTHSERYAIRHDFNDNEGPVAAAFTNLGDLLFVAMQGTNSIEVINAYTGETMTSILNVGAAPQGVVYDSEHKQLYVHAFLDRQVTLFDVANIVNKGDGLAYKVGSIQTVSRELLQKNVLAGKRIFYHAGNPQMSRDAYISCASCHLDGGHDGRTWDFSDRGEGLRNTTTLHGKLGDAHGKLHWSANFDELQDVEHDIRGHFGGMGFMDTHIHTAEGFDKSNHPLGYPKVGQSKSLDNLAAYVRSLKETPKSPFRNQDGSLTAEAAKGKQLFKQYDCASCHREKNFSDSHYNVVHSLNSITAASGKRLGKKLPGISTPTLRGVWATAPYLHDGSAKTLASLFNTNPRHGVQSVLTEHEIQQLVAYLKQIDDTEEAVATHSEICGTQLPMSHNDLAFAVFNTIQTKEAIAPLNYLVGRSIPIAEAYQIQSLYNQYMMKKFGFVIGHKMAFTSKASQKKWGIPAPVSGKFFQKQLVKSGGTVKLDTFRGFHIETEIAFTLRQDIRKPIKHVDKLNAFIGSVHTSLDVPDLRYRRDKGKLAVGDIIAMSCGTHTCVVGDGVSPDEVDFTNMIVALDLDGQRVYEGKATSVLGDPRESLRLLANQMIQAGTPLRKGQFVLTGAVTKAYSPKESDKKYGNYVGTATGLPSVRLRVD